MPSEEEKLNLMKEGPKDSWKFNLPGSMIVVTSTSSEETLTKNIKQFIVKSLINFNVHIVFHSIILKREEKTKNFKIFIQFRG